MADLLTLLRENAERLDRAISLVSASSMRARGFDEEKAYTADELEPYDALVGRFERAVEIALNKFFRAVELFEGEPVSDTVRDRLNRMEKLSLIGDVELWMRMRDVRNRISHDYLPEQVKQIYDDILKEFLPELLRLSDRMSSYLARRKRTP